MNKQTTSTILTAPLHKLIAGTPWHSWDGCTWWNGEPSNASRRLMVNISFVWQPIATAPRAEVHDPEIPPGFGRAYHYGPLLLLTDGKKFASGHHCITIDSAMTLRGLIDGKITDAFKDKIPNPKAGSRLEFWSCIGCSAFHEEVDTFDYEYGPKLIDPTHWMLLPEPPSPNVYGEESPGIRDGHDDWRGLNE